MYNFSINSEATKTSQNPDTCAVLFKNLNFVQFFPILKNFTVESKYIKSYLVMKFFKKMSFFFDKLSKFLDVLPSLYRQLKNVISSLYNQNVILTIYITRAEILRKN